MMGLGFAKKNPPIFFLPPFFFKSQNFSIPQEMLDFSHWEKNQKNHRLSKSKS